MLVWYFADTCCPRSTVTELQVYNGELVSTTSVRQNSEPVLNHAKENLAKAQRVNAGVGSCTDKRGAAGVAGPRQPNGKLWLVRSWPQLNKATALMRWGSVQKAKKNVSISLEESRVSLTGQSSHDHRANTYHLLNSEWHVRASSFCYSISRNIFAVPSYTPPHPSAFEFHIA